MGESITYGMAAGDLNNEWVQSLAGLIRRFQDSPLRVFNDAIPANVISPAAPGYDPKDVYGTAAPSAIGRNEQDMINYRHCYPYPAIRAKGRGGQALAVSLGLCVAPSNKRAVGRGQWGSGPLTGVLVIEQQRGQRPPRNWRPSIRRAGKWRLHWTE
jgi:hypothetical protein